MHLLLPSKRLKTDFSGTVSDRALNILQALPDVRSCWGFTIRRHLRLRFEHPASACVISECFSLTAFRTLPH